MTEANPIYISFNAPIVPVSVQALMGTLAKSVQDGYSEINVLLSTPGGEVNQGITLYNFIKALPVTVNMFNIGNVNSIGNVVYQAGTKRTTCEFSSFMFHGVGFDIKNERFELSHFQDKMKSLQNDQSLILEIMVRHTKMSVADIEDLFRKMAFINAQESLQHGISDEVANVSVPSGTPIEQLIFQ